MPQSDHETVADCEASATGQYLKPLLERASVKPTVVETKPDSKRTRRVNKVSRSRKVAADEPDLIAAK